ncbi:MAG: hypothetical protein JSV05_00020 [Candidatus Bathyarchaeota archaeon]|nr:MAG: hypothetical protein JSV05_00020 [Candidatus Bathyarchaeota archaeon]
MSDAELQAIRKAKLQALQKKLVKKKEHTQQANSDEILDRIFRGRAWEIFNVASQQYPKAMLKLKPSLVKLALSGRIREVTGEQLYFFLRSLGLRIRLRTHIRFTEHGKLKSLSEKIKEDLSKI